MAIGERAGVTHAAVLYHFGSSEGLLLAVLDERLRRFDAATRDAFAGRALDVLAALPEIARFNAANPELTKMFVVLKAESIDAGQPGHDYFVRPHPPDDRARCAGPARRDRAGPVPRPTSTSMPRRPRSSRSSAAPRPTRSSTRARLDLVALYESYTPPYFATWRPDAPARRLDPGRPSTAGNSEVTGWRQARTNETGA